MTPSKLTVSWEEHPSNLSYGLSMLQQNKELVDMTIAADGHFVKVHQLIMSISSPYLKDIIMSAQCPHPVIVLNKISYDTLSILLEYIYTGEVLISIEKLSDMLDAAKELHIKGLEDMDITQLLAGSRNETKCRPFQKLSSALPTDHCEDNLEDDRNDFNDNMDTCDSKGTNILDTALSDVPEQPLKQTRTVPFKASNPQDETSKSQETHDINSLQYTVSNRGSLQMILNRFIYYLKYTNRGKYRQWRCVDYLNTKKCPAYVITKDDSVVQRILAHSHPFHDKRIIKHIKTGSIFSALHEAENNEKQKKSNSKFDDSTE